ncbi:SDR family NAD(P)-dependent oxidoreductase [Oceanibacterium hippocampi]|uniref:3-oxoacyl-[acyl-carrier-protein] reductase FabG n=1 Tax=Oceanibacterium hippocampi TaxID=745714 RepID=A0A1Y5ST01_9PROT|nr:SDR family NAD(P)-dependent oxidoreductase [Oceanibacterium hippocampi]SLN47835.1 3-oxoacyl-[acyl-carrier-protein] reductase FabG [Oceanibacterium hippocampi]
MTGRDDLAGRHLVITGAAGALGNAVARLALDAGATCHLPLRGAAPPADAAWRDHPKAQVTGGIDLADEAALAGYFRELPELWGLFACAGGFAMAPLAKTSLADFRGQLDRNLVSAFLCIREAAAKMPSGGRIVAVAARPALEPRQGKGMTAYTASKAALAALVEAAAEELAPAGIWVNGVAPSIIDTAANRQAMPKADHSNWPTPAEIARTMLFLASPGNAVTRGAIVPVYGRT